MLSTDQYIITPFSRDQISFTGQCIDYVDPKFSPYQMFVFESRMQHFLEKYFQKRNSQKYKYNHFVYLDVPSQGKMITTMKLVDINDQPIELESQVIREINLEIPNIILLHPNYCLFYSDRSTPQFSRPWVRAILPSLVFEREVYEFFKEPKRILIPSVVQNGCIYLDLSDDINYEEVVQKLSSDINKTLFKFFNEGTLPEMTSQNEQIELNSKQFDEALYERIPGNFVHYKNKNGEQVMDELAGLSPVKIPESNLEIKSEFIQSSKDNLKYTTVYIVNFTKVDPGMSLTDNEIGEEFLASLKNFLEADAIVSKEVTPGYYEVYLHKNGNFMESAINIKEMFGYQFLTRNPIGLLVAQDLGLLSVSKIIYDSYHNFGGVFIPLVYLDDVVEIEMVRIQLYNRMQNVDVYTLEPNIEKEINKHQLKIVGKIDSYLFVETSPVITQRIIYRALKESKPEMLIVGEWNFISMSADYIVELVNNLLKEHHIEKTPNVRTGPFSSLIVPVLPRLAMERLIELIEIHLHQKYNFGREF